MHEINFINNLKFKVSLQFGHRYSLALQWN